MYTEREVNMEGGISIVIVRTVQNGYSESQFSQRIRRCGEDSLRLVEVEDVLVAFRQCDFYIKSSCGCHDTAEYVTATRSPNARSMYERIVTTASIRPGPSADHCN